MPAIYRLCSPNGRTVISVLAKDVTGPVVAYKARGAPSPGEVEKLLGANRMTREEKVTFIVTLDGIDEAGEETGIATGGTQAAAEAAIPTGNGQLQLEALLDAARTWPSQMGGRVRGARAYPTPGGVTDQGEVTLVLGVMADGSPWEFTGIIEAVTPTWSPEKNEDSTLVRRVTVQFHIGTVLGA